jgi:hypothetical protein
MSVIIKESGLSFGEYEKSDVFHAEKSDLYRKDGAKIFKLTAVEPQTG